MKTEFYGTRADLHEICRFAFTESGLQVWESYSVPDRELRRFDTIEQVEDAFPVLGPEESETGVLLRLWSPAMRGQMIVDRINLKPEAIRGATFRYGLEGWGLIDLNLAAGVAGELRRSSMSHTNKARTDRLFNFSGHRLGSLAEWDWEQVERLGQALHDHVRIRMAVAQMKRAVVLRGAEALRTTGKVRLAL